MRAFPLLTTILAIASLRESVSNNCDNYNDSHNSDCTEEHCSANAASPSDGVCLENGHVDSDCCAMPGSGYCSDGYSFSQGDKCHDVGAYTSCCVPTGDVPDSYFRGSRGGTYDQAKSYCEEKGATLAKILNAEDQSRAKEACGAHSCWIGLVEIGGNQWTDAADQVWEWTDGTSMEYTHWSGDEPQNHDGVDEKNAIMNCCWEYCDHNCDGGWFDAPSYHDSPRPLCSGENHGDDGGDGGGHGGDGGGHGGDCHNYNGDHSADCTDYYCPWNAASPSDAVCLEHGHVDSDCCAMPGTGSCSVGYDYAQGDRCHDVGAYTTCCVPYENTGETENTVHEYSNGVAVAVSIISSINTVLLVLFLLYGGCCTKKNGDSHSESQGLLLSDHNGPSQSRSSQNRSNQHNIVNNARLPVAQIVTQSENVANTFKSPRTAGGSGNSNGAWFST